MKPKEFEITLKLKVEADNLTVAETLATAIVHDLEKVGEEYVDRPINSVRWSRISPLGPFAPIVVNENDRAASDAKPSLVQRVSCELTGCPGCAICGPPIVVKADEGCDGGGI